LKRSGRTTSRETLDPADGTKARAFLPFYGSTSSRIGRILKKQGIRSIFKPSKKIRQFLRPVKDDLGLRVPGIYKIPSLYCPLGYIGQTRRTVEERLHEHERCIRLEYPDKSAVAQHCIETGHRIDFSATSILAKSSGYWDQVIGEALAIRLDTNLLNRDTGHQLSTAWRPAIALLAAQKKS